MRRDYLIKKYKISRLTLKDIRGSFVAKHGSFLSYRKEEPEIVWRKVVNAIIIDYERRNLFDFRNKYSSIKRSRRRTMGRLHPVWAFFRKRRSFLFGRLLRSFTRRFGPLYLKYNLGKDYITAKYIKKALDVNKEMISLRRKLQIRRNRRRGVLTPPVDYSYFFPWVKKRGVFVKLPKHMRPPAVRYWMPFWKNYFASVRSYAYAWRMRFGFWQRKYRSRLRHLIRRLLYRLHMLGRIYRNLYCPTPAMLKKPPYKNMAQMEYLFSRIELPSPKETRAQLLLSKAVVRVLRLVTKCKQVKFPLLWRWLHFLNKIEKKLFLKKFRFSFFNQQLFTKMSMTSVSVDKLKLKKVLSAPKKSKFSELFNGVVSTVIDGVITVNGLKSCYHDVLFHKSVVFFCRLKAFLSHSALLFWINGPRLSKKRRLFSFFPRFTNHLLSNNKESIDTVPLSKPGFLLLGWEYLKRQVKFGFVRRRLNNQQNFILQLTYDNPRVAFGDYEDGFRIPYIPRDHQKRSKKQARMLEHYRLQIFYGIFDMRLFKKKYFDLFKTFRNFSSARLNQLLECRVIFLLQLTNFFSSIYFIDQIIKHRCVVVNDELVTESHKVLNLGDDLFMPEEFYWLGLNTFLYKLANFRLLLNMPRYVEPNYVLGGLSIIEFPLKSQLTLPFGKQKSSYDPSFVIREFIK